MMYLYMNYCLEIDVVVLCKKYVTVKNEIWKYGLMNSIDISLDE
jgi:hypothetical protein